MRVPLEGALRIVLVVCLSANALPTGTGRAGELESIQKAMKIPAVLAHVIDA